MFPSSAFESFGDVFPQDYAPMTRLTAVEAPVMSDMSMDSWREMSLALVVSDIMMLSGTISKGMNRMKRALEGQITIAKYLANTSMEMSSKNFQIPSFLGNHGYSDLGNTRTLQDAIDDFLLTAHADLEPMYAHVYGYLKSLQERDCVSSITEEFLAINRLKATTFKYKTSYKLGKALGNTDDYTGVPFVMFLEKNPFSDNDKLVVEASWLMSRLFRNDSLIAYNFEEDDWSYDDVYNELMGLNKYLNSGKLEVYLQEGDEEYLLAEMTLEDTEEMQKPEMADFQGQEEMDREQTLSALTQLADECYPDDDIKRDEMQFRSNLHQSVEETEMEDV